MHVRVHDGAGRRRRGCRSTSRRGSSRRSCAAARYTEPPDITARICGICPVAYQMSACRAIEDACGVAVDGPIADLRRLLYCGEWIESHACTSTCCTRRTSSATTSAIGLARDHRAARRARAAPEEGRQRDPRTARRAGRSTRSTSASAASTGARPAPNSRPLAERLRHAPRRRLETVRWVAGFDFPDFEHRPRAAGPAPSPARTPSRPASRRAARPDDDARAGQLPAAGDFDRTTSSRSRCRTPPPCTPSSAARRAISPARSPATRSTAAALAAGRCEAAGRPGSATCARGAECRNPFRSIVVRAVEVVYAVDEALRIIEAYEPPAPSARRGAARAPASGYGATEAPRGLLYHRYALDADGDRHRRPHRAAHLAEPGSHRGRPAPLRPGRARPGGHDAELTAQCERAIRNYDPCISCATHFLDLTIDRS